MRPLPISIPAATLALALALPLAALVASALPAGALAGTVAQRQSASPSSLLVTRKVLGTGWSVSAPALKKVPSLVCGALHLRLRGGAAHPAAVGSPTFRETSSGPFVAETANLFDTVAEAGQVWHGVERHAQLTCMARSVTASSTGRVRLRVVSEHELAAPRVGVRSAAYRVTATASQGSQSVNAYLDVILLSWGHGVAELSFSSLVAPPPSRLERRLAVTVAGALRSAAAAGAHPTRHTLA